MIMVLSGEGPSDIGMESPTERGLEFTPGPMAWIVDRLLESDGKLGYPIISLHCEGADCVHFVSESGLAALRTQKPLFLPRGEDGMGNMFHRKGAYLFGKYSKEIGRVRNSPVIAVFFRDGDGTRSTPLTEWQSKFKSVVSGFEASEFPAGVPMIPRPKSEAWMLCGLFKHENPACDCAWLEEESGNDGSPKSLKGQLGAHLSGADSAEEQAYLVKNGRIDPEQIDLPSFEAFKTALDAAFVNCRMPE